MFGRPSANSKAREVFLQNATVVGGDEGDVCQTTEGVLAERNRTVAGQQKGCAMEPSRQHSDAARKIAEVDVLRLSGLAQEKSSEDARFTS